MLPKVVRENFHLDFFSELCGTLKHILNFGPFFSTVIRNEIIYQKFPTLNFARFFERTTARARAFFPSFHFLAKSHKRWTEILDTHE